MLGPHTDFASPFTDALGEHSARNKQQFFVAGHGHIVANLPRVYPFSIAKLKAKVAFERYELKKIVLALALLALTVWPLSVANAEDLPASEQGARAFISGCEVAPCSSYFADGESSPDGKYFYALVAKPTNQSKVNPSMEYSIVRIDVDTKAQVQIVAPVTCSAFAEPLTNGTARECHKLRSPKISNDGKSLIYSDVTTTDTLQGTYSDGSLNVAPVLKSSKLQITNLAKGSRVDLLAKYSLKDSSTDGAVGFWHANSKGVFIQYSPATSVSPTRFVNLTTNKISNSKQTDFYIAMSPNGKFGVTLASAGQNFPSIKNVASGKSVAFTDMHCSYECYVFDDGVSLMARDDYNRLIYAKSNGLRVQQNAYSTRAVGRLRQLPTKYMISADESGQGVVFFKLKTS